MLPQREGRVGLEKGALLFSGPPERESPYQHLARERRVRLRELATRAEEGSRLLLVSPSGELGMLTSWRG